MTTNNITLSMIVKNEAHSLPQCIGSVQGVVEEMVVLDTGSTDDTVTIAQELGAKVYHFEWINDFSAAHNYCLQYVKTEWVLVLDADELLTKEIVPYIREVVKSAQNLVVNLVREEVGALQSPYSMVSRLFRLHPSIQFARPYHCMIDDSVQKLLRKEPHWRIVDTPVVGIVHYGYQPEAIASLDKYKRACTIMEGFLKLHPRDPYVCSKLGALYLKIGETEKGFELLKRGLKAKKMDIPVLFELHYHLANTYTRMGNTKRALHHYQEAITQPLLPLIKLGAYNNLAGLYQHLGKFTEALRIYQTILQIDPEFALAYYNQGMTLKALGDYSQAIASYEKALQFQPNYPYTYQNIGVVYLKIGDMTQAISYFQQAISLHEKDNPLQAENLRQGLLEIGIRL